MIVFVYDPMIHLSNVHREFHGVSAEGEWIGLSVLVPDKRSNVEDGKDGANF